MTPDHQPPDDTPQKAAVRRYRQTEKGRKAINEVVARYFKAEKGKETARRYAESEKGKKARREAQRRYKQRLKEQRSQP